MSGSWKRRKVEQQRKAFADGLEHWWVGRIYAMNAANANWKEPRHPRFHDDWLIDGPTGSTSICSLCYKAVLGPADRAAYSKRIFAEIMADLEAL